MHTTEPITSTTSRSPTRGDLHAELLPVIGTIYVAGPPVLLLWAGTVLLALMLAGPFALLVTLVALLVVAMLLVALAGAILASPNLLIRHFRRHRAEHAVAHAAPRLTTVRSTGVPA